MYISTLHNVSELNKIHFGNKYVKDKNLRLAREGNRYKDLLNAVQSQKLKSSNPDKTGIQFSETY